MKKLIPVVALFIAGCTTPKESSFVVPDGWSKIPPSEDAILGKQYKTHVDQILSIDGTEITLDEFNEMILSGKKITMDFYVDESGQTNAVVKLLK